MVLWIAFVVCSGIIVYSGSRLSKYGDILAEKTGLGGTWIGLIMLASVTSLPELMTGISSVTIADVPNIAVGDVLGSCVFNMLIFAMLDIGYKSLPLSTKAQQGNILSAASGILLLSFVAGSIVFQGRIAPFGWIGLYSLLIIFMYVIAMRLVFFYEKRLYASFAKELKLKYKDIQTKTAIIQYSVNAAIVIVAAVFLPQIGVGIAESTGLGTTFVGNILIALSTSLPEVVVSITAIKMDAIDLAIGNLFGSNIFNIFILAIDDIFFIKGPILAYVEISHIFSAVSAIAMTSIAILGLTYRARKKPLFLAWDSIAIVLVYIVNLMSLYTVRN